MDDTFKYEVIPQCSKFKDERTVRKLILTELIQRLKIESHLHIKFSNWTFIFIFDT